MPRQTTSEEIWKFIAGVTSSSCATVPVTVILDVFPDFIPGFPSYYLRAIFFIHLLLIPPLFLSQTRITYSSAPYYCCRCPLSDSLRLTLPLIRHQVISSQPCISLLLLLRLHPLVCCLVLTLLKTMGRAQLVIWIHSITLIKRGISTMKFVRHPNIICLYEGKDEWVNVEFQSP
ncbi:uncharacterized protein LOC141647701 [Silene latifolia]|uniref:uncharacterized protein LOC141647701 n=1 Tax=Silene latifolia TaxID=37657 RepID=UPI003D76B856